MVHAFAHLLNKAKKRHEPPLPNPFELPRNFPPIVTVGLEERKLCGKARGKFLSSIAAAVYMKKCYPTAEEYRHIGDRIIKFYPFLKSSNGYGYVRSMNPCSVCI